MTTSADLLDLIEAAVLGPSAGAQPPVFATVAGDRVKRPGDLPTQNDQYPILKLRIVSESRQSLGKGSVQFQTTATIRVVGEVSAPAAIGDVAASTAESQLWALKRQYEIAIINSYPLFRVVEQLEGVQTQLAFAADQSTHLAGIQSDFAFQFFEDEDDFAPIASDALTEVTAEDRQHPPSGFTANLPQ